MSIKFGLKTQKVFFGNKEIIKVYKGDKKVYEITGAVPGYYVQVSSSDFNSSGDYTGTEEYIILPADKPSGYEIVNPAVKGVATKGDYLTDASYMFRNNNSLYLELDYLDTSQVIDLYQMFRDSQATSLDLSNFNTSNVIKMRFMFHSAQATTLDLSSFDTRNVTDMGYMFVRSQASTLDLSSFDTSNVTDMLGMFLGAQTTTGYARTQAEADRFNSSSNKPSTLNFVIKGKLVPDEFVLKQDYSVQDFQQLISYFEIDPNLSFPGTNITNVLEVSVSGYVWSMKDLYDLSYFNGVLRIYDNNYDYTLELTEDTNNGLYSDITFVFNNGA